MLAGGYLFAAFMTVPHALSFPRLFAPDGLIGAGPQTTAWLYMIWHAGFPLAVIGYALLRDSERVRRPVLAIGVACAVVLAVVCGATLLTTTGHDLLPAIMHGDGYTSVLPIATGTVWSLSFVALLVLWMRRPYSVLDVWLMVVMSTWLFDIALSALLNAGRFDVGLLCRPRLRSDGRDPGAAGAADRDRRGLCPAGAFLSKRNATSATGSCTSCSQN